MERLKMQTPDLVDENIEKIGNLFPECLTERIGPDGKNPELAIDIDKLAQLLSKKVKVVNGQDERYQFTWPGKQQSIITANTPINKTLRPCRDKSVDFDNTENLYIEGDNLEVLKLLREDYLGKVKMVYIDPPYNTGNDLVYKDNFAQSTEDYIENSGLNDNDGNRLVANRDSNGRFHTNWLNMIYPRLKIAKDLMSDDGVIFISIDDNELENLRKICNEIFGEVNFLAQITWEKRFTRSNNAKMFASLTDYILVYRKNLEDLTVLRESRNTKNDSIYSNPDNDPRGVWTSVSYVNPASRDQRPNLCYEIENPITHKMVSHPTNAWKYEYTTYQQHVKENKLYWGKNGENQYPRLKKFLWEMKGGIVPANLWYFKDVGTTDVASKDLEKLMGRGIFDFPKPVNLIKRMLDITTDKGDSSIILDFFSGSATTAHAVMQLNSEDGGNRKFILVQIPECTPQGSLARNSGFNDICAIGEERIRRAGKKILQEQPTNSEKNNKVITSNLDVGFRVLKLDSSNMKDVYYKPSDVTNEIFAKTEDNIKEDRTDEDLLFQVMLEMAVPLSAKIHSEEIFGKKVLIVDDDYLIACFDNNITDEVVTDIAKRKPQYFVMRDSSVMDDSVITNFETIFQTFSKDTVRKIL